MGSRQWRGKLAIDYQQGTHPRPRSRLVPWSLDRKGLTSGFVPGTVAGDLDFEAVHLFPEAGKLDEALDTLKGFSVGKPVVVEETVPLKCLPKELGEFIDQAGPHAAG